MSLHLSVRNILVIILNSGSLADWWQIPSCPSAFSAIKPYISDLNEWIFTNLLAYLKKYNVLSEQFGFE